LFSARKRRIEGWLDIFRERCPVNGAKTELIGELFPTGRTLFHLYPRSRSDVGERLFSSGFFKIFSG
jgi:hypothetical protein